MDRSIYFSQSQTRTFDIVSGDVDKLISQSNLSQDLLGGTTTMLAGLAATQSSPTANLVVNIAAGRIYQIAEIDATADGAIVENTNTVLQQGYTPATTVTLSTTGITSGQSRWSLIQAQFSQVDVIRANDPTGGLLYFYNSANPSQPFEGPGNDGQTSYTERKGELILEVINGAAASTGSEVPPNPTSGWTPLYLIDLAFGQTQITTGEILEAGPSVGTNVPSNYQQAPFLAGLLNSHHAGITGQAPQIKLASEVQGTLPLSNMPASNTTGGLPTMRLYAGNPNSHVAGNANVNGASDLCYDTTNSKLYVCTTTGTTGTAVWTLAEPTSSGTVSSVTFTGDGTVLSSTPSSAVTTSGTVAASLNTQSANTVLAGPTTGSAANPTFRSLVTADMPASVALLASPTFSGTPAAPTASSGTNTTQLATCAFAYGSVSESANGYTVLPNGLIFQWGNTTSATPSFPTSFPTACLFVIPSWSYNNSATISSYYNAVTAKSTSGFTLGQAASGVATSSTNWYAVGY